MSTNKHIDKICGGILVFVLILTAVFVNAGSLGVEAVSRTMGYEQKLFDTSVVHTIDIEMDNWEGFLETCEDEEYVACSVIIDNEAYTNVGIRAKGNTSLSQVSSYGNDRYSFKIEFDKYDSSKSYYGLDKLSLNNIIQDNTYMKDYLCYQMMGQFGAAAPLCSYVYITVNGEEWGLYLAVEGVEEAFLARNYGSDYGELYKPDSSDMGGGRGNGGKFDMDEMQEFFGFGTIDGEEPEGDASDTKPQGEMQMTPGGGTDPMQQNDRMGNFDDSQFQGGMDGNFDESQLPDGMDGNFDEPQLPDGMDGGLGDIQDFDGMDNGQGGMEQFSMGSNDVSLIYSDDAYESYQNIFGNAKTDITDSDKDRLIASLKNLNAQENIEETVDVESVIRYFVVHNFVCNFDSYTGSMIHNYYLYEKNGQLSMIPWDYNLAFGGFQSQSNATSLVNYPIDTPVSGGTVDSRPMLSWILQNEEYLQLYHEYFAKFLSQYFDDGALAAEIDRVSKMISPYVEKDPTKFCTYEEFETGIATLKEFCILRAQSIAGQLDGTIPSTSDGQSENSDTLIDASHLTISDMGSMGNMGGMGDDGNMGGEGFDNAQMPDGMQAPDGMQIPDNGMQTPDGAQIPDNGMQAPDSAQIPDNGMQTPDGAHPDSGMQAPDEMPDFENPDDFPSKD